MLFIITWLLCGLLISLILTACDLRGKEYNQNYFDGDFWITFLGFTISGYASVVAVIITIFVEKTLGCLLKFEPGKIIYKIANIGVKKCNLKTENNNEGGTDEKN